MKAYGGVEEELYSLTSTLDGGEFMLYPINPQERASHTHSIGGCVESKAGQETLGKR